MLFQELRRHLSEQESSAIEYLESIGYQIMTEARLDDCKKKDGSRVRTFSLRGRYDLMIGLKSIQGRAQPPQTVAEVAQVDDGIEAEEARVVGDNFWMKRDRWLHTWRDDFFVLVTEEKLDDLKAAPQDVQEDVQEKFLRFFEDRKSVV